jgi:hypothetical protein
LRDKRPQNRSPGGGMLRRNPPVANERPTSEKNFKDQQNCQKLRKNSNVYLHAAVAGIFQRMNDCYFEAIRETV